MSVERKYDTTTHHLDIRYVYNLARVVSPTKHYRQAFNVLNS